MIEKKKDMNQWRIIITKIPISFVFIIQQRLKWSNSFYIILIEWQNQVLLQVINNISLILLMIYYRFVEDCRIHKTNFKERYSKRMKERKQENKKNRF